MFFFLCFLALFDRYSEELQVKERWRKSQKGHRSDSNRHPPFSVIWHLVTCTELNQRPGTAFSSH